MLKGAGFWPSYLLQNKTGLGAVEKFETWQDRQGLKARHLHNLFGTTKVVVP
jgi:hypothetical protein